MRKIIITASPATPNGDLHVGHLSGPYLAADIFARFARLRGCEVIFGSYSDSNQSYVKTSAERLKMRPAELCRKYTAEIRETLAAAEIRMDAWVAPDQTHVALTRDFLRRLYDEGKLITKEKELYYCEELGQFVFEAYLSGHCPECLAETKAGICETCGHPNNFTEILDPFATMAPHGKLSRRPVRLVVLELERYRDEFRAFFSNKWSRWRPHVLRLVNECLERHLPDFPITYPSDWGIAAPFPGCEDQVINPWAELLTGLMRCTGAAASERPGRPEPDELWHRQHGYELVQFFGFDNSFFFTFLHVGLLMAHGDRYILPDVMGVNEFYELENSKFSTSRNHLIWAKDLLAECGSDELRFYLSLTNPQTQKTNFTKDEMRHAVEEKLRAPWRHTVATLNELFGAMHFVRGATYHPTSAGIERAQILTGRFERFYEAASMDLRSAAEEIGYAFHWVAARARTLSQAARNSDRVINPRLAVDLWYMLRTLSIVIGPLLPAASDRFRWALGVEDQPVWPVAGSWPVPIRPCRLPEDLLQTRPSAFTDEPMVVAAN